MGLVGVGEVEGLDEEDAELPEEIPWDIVCSEPDGDVSSCVTGDSVTLCV